MSDPTKKPNVPVTNRDAAFNDPAMRALADGPEAPIKAGHPRGLYTLFMTEMWERFSYYGMKALLSLFLIAIVGIHELPAGKHDTLIKFEDDTHHTVQTRTHTIAIDDANAKATPSSPAAAPGALKVTPETNAISLASKGTRDVKVIKDASTIYTLTNTSAEPLKYIVSADRSANGSEDGKPIFVKINSSTSPLSDVLEPGKSQTFEVSVSTENGGMGWSKPRTGNLLAWYNALAYLLPLLGGYLADRYLGQHRCLVIGGSIIAAGHFTLMFDTLPTLYAGLALVIVGTGFFKSNVSSMVGQLYKQGDARRDAGFTIFYMGINLGAFIAPIFCGWLRVKYGWSYGFGAAGFGMVAGLIQYLIGRPKHLVGIGEAPKRIAVADGGSASNAPLTREERSRVAVIFILTFFVTFFWTAFEQASGSMAFFGEEKTDKSLPSWLNWTVGQASNIKAEFPAEWFQSINPLMILILAPLFASIWVRLARTTFNPSTPAKLAMGIITVGIGFIFMVVGAQNATGGVKVTPFWIFAAFLLHTCGELCLSPVGLSMVSKLAPAKFLSLLMGVWFLANFVANFVAGQTSGQIDAISKSGFILPGQAGFFLLFTIIPIATGIVLFAITPVLKKMMHGRG